MQGNGSTSVLKGLKEEPKPRAAPRTTAAPACRNNAPCADSSCPNDHSNLIDLNTDITITCDTVKPTREPEYVNCDTTDKPKNAPDAAEKHIYGGLRDPFDLRTFTATGCRVPR